MSDSGFTPIIEPVKDSLNGLCRAIEAIKENEGNAIVVVNPEHGDLSGAGEPISRMLQDTCLEYRNVTAGILLKEDTTVAEAMTYYKSHTKHAPVFIHSGFVDAKGLATALGSRLSETSQIFVDSPRFKLSAKHFKSARRVLLRDGFKRRKNKDYPDVEDFSDLHATYPDEGMDGFGDFLVVGNDYSDGGALPFVLAIHLTYIDSSEDDLMRIYHFKSKVHATQKDPAGKFLEALDVMMRTLNSNDSQVYETDAVGEFRELFRKGHFPGLGHLKKLSMNHHVQTLAKYQETRAQ